MSLVLNDNFTGAAGQGFTGDAVYTLLSGTPTLVASSYGVGVRFGSGTTSVLRYSVTALTGPRTFSRIYKLSAAPGGASNSEIFQIRASPSGASSLLRVFLTPTGTLRLQNAANSAFTTSAAAVPFATEFRVVYIVNSAGTNFSAAIYPDITSTTPTQTISITVTGTSFDRVHEGNITSGGLPSATLDLIWPQDDDTATDPGIRIYVTCSLDLPSGVVPVLVTATAAVQNSPAGTKTWTFHWGDGNITGPQSSNTAAHTYSVAGTYTVTVDLDVV